jgi:hypothetical protein
MTDRTSSDERDDDLQLVAFITAPALPPGTATLQNKGPTTQLTRRLEEVKEDWERMVGQISSIISNTQARAGELQFKDVSIGLAFSASGKLAFVAEAGVEASITVTFSRAEA